MQFLENKFKIDSETTVGVEFGSKIVEVAEERVKLQIWDTVLIFLLVRLGRKSLNLSLGLTIGAPSGLFLSMILLVGNHSTTSPSGSMKLIVMPMKSSQ